MESPSGVTGLVEDWASDKQAYNVPWGKAMMWIFLVSDTFIFTCFLTGLSERPSYHDRAVAAPNRDFRAHTLFGQSVPLVLIAIMTFILITSSGSMALAVNFGYRRDKTKTFLVNGNATAMLGASFVGMQAFEWTKLIQEGVRPWTNPFGAAQFGSVFFMVTGFHGLHVTGGVIYLLVVATKIRKGHYDKKDLKSLKLLAFIGIS